MSEYELPRSEDRLFQGAEDWQFNACVHFKFHPSRKEHAYVRGYKLAGDALFDKVAQERHVVDLIVYPMVYNYRHYIELSLKAILLWGSAVLEVQPRKKPDHFLDGLWRLVRPLLEERWHEQDDEVLDSVEKLILEFARIDPRSTAFRYHEHDSSQKKPAITLDTEALTHINVRNLCEVMGRLSTFFDGVLMQLQVDWDNLCEVRQIEEEIRREYESEWESIATADFYDYRDAGSYNS